MLAKQLSFLANADSAGLVLGARVPIILTSRADSVRSRIASCAVAMLAAHARRQRRPGERVATASAVEGDHGRLRRRAQRRLVEPEVLRLLQAGDGTLAASKPAARSRASARRRDSRSRTARASSLDDQRAGQGGARRPHRARFARRPGCARRYGGARVLGVGHRVVHGGAQFAGPTIVTPAGAGGSAKRWYRSRRCISRTTSRRSTAVTERLPGVPQVACFDTSFHRGQPAVAELVPLPREICRGGVQRYGFHGLSYEYIASVLPQVAPEIAGGRVIVAHLGSGASLCALKNGKSVDSTLGFTALDGLCMGTRPGARRSRRGPLPVPEPRAVRRRTSRRSSTRSRACSASPASATTCAICSAAPSPAPGWRSTTSSTARRRRSARWPRCWAASTAWSSPPASARTPPRSAGGSARPRRGSASSSIDEANDAQDGPRISPDGSRVSAWVIPTNEELMIARHTGVLLGLIEAQRLDKHGRSEHRKEGRSWPRPHRRHSKTDTTAPPGRDFEPVSGRRRSTSATSSSRTTSRTTATSRSSRRRPSRTQAIWDKLKELFVEERKKGVLDVSQIPSSITAHAPGYIDREQRDHRRPADRRAAEARDHAERRLPPGGQRAQGLRLRARSARRRGVHQVPQDPQRRRVRRLHRRRAPLPQLAHPHRPARRLRPRPDHRRLPPRRALRRRPADRAQAGGEARPRRRARRPTRSSATARSWPSRSARSRN